MLVNTAGDGKRSICPACGYPSAGICALCAQTLADAPLDIPISQLSYPLKDLPPAQISA